MAYPIRADITGGTFVEIVALGLVERGETSNGWVAGVIRTDISVITNGGVVADAYTVFTFVRIGTDIAVITEQRIVQGVFAGIVFKAFVESAGVSVVAEVFVDISITIVVETIADLRNRRFSNTGGFSVHTGDHALARTMFIGDLAGDGCSRIVDDAVTVVVSAVTNIFAGC